MAARAAKNVVHRIRVLKWRQVGTRGERYGPDASTSSRFGLDPVSLL